MAEQLSSIEMFTKINSIIGLIKEVIGVEEIDLTTTLQSIGYNSLKIIELKWRLEEDFNMFSDIEQKYMDLTIEVIIDELISQQYIMSSTQAPAIIGAHAAPSLTPLALQEYYSTSSAQKRMYLLNKIEANNTSYNIPTVRRVKGKFDVTLAKKILQCLVDRHESLRTSFILINGEIVQKIHDNVTIDIEIKEISEADIHMEIDEFIKPLDISIAPIFDAKILKINDETHILMTNTHHIVYDGTSQSVFWSEFARLYQGQPLSELDIQYKEFAHWHNELLESEEGKKQEQYWLDLYNDEIPLLNLSTDKMRPTIQSFNGDIVRFSINAELTKRLKNISTSNGTTLYMSLLAIYNILLSRYTGQEDIIIGTATAGRQYSSLNNIVGMFVNTLALRNKPKGNANFIEFLADVKRQVLSAFENQDYPFEELVDKLNLQRDISRNPLFDVMFILQNITQGNRNIEGLQLENLHRQINTSKFDLTLSAFEMEETLTFEFNYSTDLFEKETIERMAGHFIKIIEEVLKDENKALSEIDMLTEAERNQILIDFNDTYAEYPKDKCIHEIFEEQVEKTPDNIALIYEGQEMTYKELNNRANRLARKLRSLGVKPDDRVAIICERSMEFVIGVMAILKAGGAYVSIDPMYPNNRVKFILDDCSVQHILIHNVEYEFADFTYVDIANESTFEAEISNLHIINNPDSLAYVTYTSGSTGEPKGIMIKHIGVVNHITWAAKEFITNTKETFALHTSTSFDFAMLSVFLPLTTGNAVAIYNESEDYLLKTVADDNKCTILKLTPSHMSLFNTKKLSNTSITTIISAGEKLNNKLAQKIYDMYSGNINIINEYGPTETTMCCMAYKFDRRKHMCTSTVPVGKPADNMKVYIVDKFNNLCAIGIAGELCISGDGLSRGYLNNQELTNQKFVYLDNITKEKIYRTGDLAKWLEDGNIEILGRVDNQVKIRGHRVEIDEITNQLMKLPDVKDSAVLAKDDGMNISQEICAFVVLNNNCDIQGVKTKLLQELPSYMVPSQFIKLNTIPLNRNGKVDSSKLLSMDYNSSTINDYFEEASTSTETKLLEIWKDILQLDKININDNFFMMGGQSLKAVILCAKVVDIFNINLTLSEVFNNSTIKELSTLIDSQRSISSAPSLTPLALQEYYSTSSAQKRMYLLNKIEANNTSYNIPTVRRVKGKFDVTLAKKILQCLVDRHESLRTSFILINGEIVQKIHDNVTIDIEIKEISEADIHMEIDEFIKPLDISIAPIFDAKILKINDETHILMTNTHHIVYDGTSQSVFWSEFARLYQGQPLSELDIQYKEFAHWHNELLESEEGKKQEQYWLDLYNDEIPLLNLSTDKMRPTIQSFNGDIVRFSINAELTKRLKNISTSNGTTLYMSLLAIYNILLSRYTGQEDIIIGTATAGRQYSSLNNIVGMFVNTLALRNKPKGNANFIEFLADVKRQVLSAFENQDYPFEELVDKLNLQRDISRNPLFDVMFILQNITQGNRNIEGLQLENLHRQINTSKFDLTLSAFEMEETLTFEFNYSTDLFEKETIERMAGHFIKIIEEVLKDENKALSEIDMLTEAERNQILIDFNDTYAEYPKDKCIHEIFEEQVEKTPDNIALIYEGQEMTYKELNNRANRLARKLRSLGVKPDDRVAIICERSMEFVIGVMAILKAGGAYVPIDPAYPEKRVNYILGDCGSRIILLKNDVLNSYNFSTDIDIAFIEDCNLYEKGNLINVNKSNDLAYVIYTSGSTGKPKGVMVEHESVINLAFDLSTRLNISDSSRWLFKTAYTFDVSISEIFGWFINGASLIIASQGVEKDIALLAEIIIHHQVTHVNFVPSMLKVFINNLSRDTFERMNSLNYILSAGESLDSKIAYNLKEKSDVRLENLYGPTEATVFSTVFSVDSKLLDNGKNINIPIGTPLSNYKAYILDANGMLCPIGVQGELYLGGPGISRGYLNNHELTNNKFIESKRYLNRLYKTGDIAKWLPDGNILFLGRMDDQIKIRGYRIELGEIIEKLCSIEGILESHVVAKDDEFSDSKVLLAYFISNFQYTVNDLYSELAKDLPEYMIPNKFIQLEEFPISSSGKIDTKKLLSLDSNLATGEIFVEPNNNTEKNLLKIWTDVLNINKISINDDFFVLGGHSLKGLVLINRINEVFSVNMRLSDLFYHSTIKAMGEFVNSTINVEYVHIPKADTLEFYPTTPAQKRMFTLNKLIANSTSYNVSYIRCIKGKLNLDLLEDAVSSLVRNNEILRTTYEFVDNVLMQKIHVKVNINLEVQKIQEYEVEEQISKFIRPFDLEKEIPIRVGILRIKLDEYIFLLDIHHIATDAISSRIFINELIDFYNNEPVQKKPLQYKDFAVWFNSKTTQNALKTQKDYWLEIFSESILALELPFDKLRPRELTYKGYNFSFSLSNACVNKLHELTKRRGITSYMFILCILNILFAKYSQQDDIVIGTPVAGRRTKETEDITGIFINTLAIRSNPTSNKLFLDFLKEIKETVLLAYENQDYPFEDLVKDLEINRNSQRNPLFDVMFVMHNRETFERSFNNIITVPYRRNQTDAKFDLTLSAFETEETLTFEFNYSTDLFEKETIERMAGHFTKIIEEVLEDDNKPLSEIDMLTEAERNQILIDFNDTNVEYPKDKCIHELFEEQVEKTPDNIALIYEGQEMTYKELNNRANRLARKLRSLGVKPDDRVAIICERSFDLIISIIGTLKSGGAYVPIDSTYPSNRIKYILNNSKPKVVLIQKDSIVNNIEFYDLNNVYFIDEAYVQSLKSDNLSLVNTSKDLAYLIYTSGSTGSPKGVMIEHENLSNFLNWAKMRYGKKYTTSYTTALITSISFDLTVPSIYLPIISGGKIYMDKEDNLVESLQSAFQNSDINMLKLTPSHFKLYIETCGLPVDNKILIIGGEEFKYELISRVELNNVIVYNEYGPTETTVGCIFYEYSTFNNVNIKRMPIGIPISNTHIYILSKENLLCPIGIVGEIYISGASVGRGYFNQIDKTNELFITDYMDSSKKMYRSGDIGKWLPNGEIDFVGRKDNQVKINGYRIELAEIEYYLKEIEGIDDACVVVKSDNEKDGNILIGYLIGKPELNIYNIKQQLLLTLPNYMIPSKFIRLDKLPLTTNGKIDFTKLNTFDNYLHTESDYILPNNDLESSILDSFKSILKCENIGTQDNFFELGGTSLDALILANRISVNYHKVLSLSAIINHPTVTMLASLIQATDKCNINNSYTIYNNRYKKDKVIIAFPPMLGYGAVYSGLSELLDEYSIMAFDYLDAENHQKIDAYLQLIEREVGNGPYVFLTYSAGISLAYSVTVELEKHNKTVSDIILLDSFININYKKRQKKEFEKELQLHILGLEQEIDFKTTLEKSKLYYEYYSKISYNKKISSDIHLIYSINESNHGNYKDLTYGKVYEYLGYGNHFDMLKASCLEKNADLIYEIILSKEIFK